MAQLASPGEHERGLPLLVEPGYRTRLRESLANPRRRCFRDELLAHVDRLDHRLTHHLGTNFSHSRCAREPCQCGAPDHCYLIACDDDLDVRELPLEDALWPGQLTQRRIGLLRSRQFACFLGGEVDNRCILERK